MTKPVNQDTEVVTIHCPVCKETDIGNQWPAQKISKTKFILWCKSCGYGWQHPLPTPEEIRDYYDNYPTYNLHGANEKEKAFSRRLERINRFMPDKGKILDVGSGLGDFLAIAKKNGWEAEGIEPQKSAAEHCAKQHGIKVHNGFIDELSLPPESFDVVTLWDVLEHVHNPIDFLEHCTKLVAPNGLLVIAIPNASGWPARLFKGRWRYVMNTHLSYFSKEYIYKEIMARNFDIIKADHTIKVHSLIEGIASILPFNINTEKLIRAGRKGSSEKGRPEQLGTKESDYGLRFSLLYQIRKIALTINLTRLPISVGDLVDIYCRKNQTHNHHE